MTGIQILVVANSAVVRQMIRDSIREDLDFHVTAVSTSGASKGGPQTRAGSRKELTTPSPQSKVPLCEDAIPQRLVVIGASTGGPRALQEVLTRIPAAFSGSVFVVQHMPAHFTKSLAARLDELCAMQVSEAKSDERVAAGRVYIAPGDFHMTLGVRGSDLTIQLDQSPPVNGHRPAVDVLFESVAKLEGRAITAVLLTGMGSDGSQGIMRIKNRGGFTIAESEDTCTVFGMPKAAIGLGCIDAVLPLERIALAIYAGQAR